MKARYLKRATLEGLRENVPQNLELYRSGSFEHLVADSSQTFEAPFSIDEVQLAGLLTPEGNNYYESENCARCYQALSTLSAYEARDERFWALLTHTVLLEYTRKRWPIPSDADEAIEYIRLHFFARDARGVERNNSASRLWWMAHLCRRVSEMPYDKCLEVLLYRSDVRASIIERPTMSQNPQIFSAILKTLSQSYDGKKALFEREAFRKLMVRMNSVGGVKLLDAMNGAQIEALISDIVFKEIGLQAV